MARKEKIKVPPLKGQMYAEVKNFSDSATNVRNVNETLTTDLEKGNVITSLVERDVTKHKVVIDLDLPAKLVESSTPGHFHLFIDHEIPKDVYFELIAAMVKAGLVEPGYLAASEARGYSAVRVPWVKKTPEEMVVSNRIRKAKAEAAKQEEPYPF